MGKFKEGDKLTIGDISILNIGDKIKVMSNDKNWYLSGLYNGIILEIVEKKGLLRPEDFKKVTVVVVKYTPMRYAEDENGKKIPNGELLEEPIERALPENPDCDGYWYEFYKESEECK